MKSELATSSDYDRMIKSRSQTEAFEHLSKRKHIVTDERGKDTTDMGHLEREYDRTLRRISSMSPLVLRKLIASLREEDTLMTMSHLLEGIALDVSTPDLLSNLPGYSGIDPETVDKLSRIRPVRRAVEALEDRELRDAILVWLSKFGQHQELAIDLACRNVIMHRIRRSSTGPWLSRSLSRLIGHYLDALTLVLLARAVTLKMDSELVNSILSSSHHRFSQDESKSLVRTESLEKFVEILRKTAYKSIVSASPRTYQTVSSFEADVNRGFARSCQRLFGGWRFDATTPIAFIFLKRYEIQDIRSILTGRMRDVDPEAIRRNLILNQDLVPA